MLYRARSFFLSFLFFSFENPNQLGWNRYSDEISAFVETDGRFRCAGPPQPPSPRLERAALQGPAFVHATPTRPGPAHRGKPEGGSLLGTAVRVVWKDARRGL